MEKISIIIEDEYEKVQRGYIVNASQLAFLQTLLNDFYLSRISYSTYDKCDFKDVSEEQL
jgi:hypothetical protein